MKTFISKFLSWLCLWSIAFCSAWAADGDYVKVTAAPDDWSGEYLIVYEESANSGIAMNGALETLDAAKNGVQVVVKNGVISLKDNPKADLSNFVIALLADGNYSIKSASGLYIGYTGNKNGLSTAEKTVYKNTIALANGKFTITSKANSTTPSYLQFNKTSGQERFRYFAKNGSQQPVALYKKEDNGGGKEKTLSSVTLSGTLTKTEYLVGETFDPKGLVLTANYSDNSTEVVTDKATWECDPTTLTEAGDKTVLVMATYLEQSDMMECTVHVTESDYLIAKLGTFGDVSGNLNADVTYSAEVGYGTNNPQSGNFLNLYQSSNKVGNYLTLSGQRGVTLQSATIFLTNKYATPVVATLVGEFTEDDYPTKGETLEPSSSYTKENINNRQVTFFCLGRNKDSRLAIDSIVVYYTKEVVTLSRLSLDTTNVVQLYKQNQTFSTNGLKVWAVYDNNDSIDVTQQAQVIAPEMSTAGRKSVVVKYTEGGQTLTASYGIEIEAVDYLFYESFNNNTGKGGNDDNWDGTAGNNPVVVFDQTGWTQTNVYGADKCVKLSTSSAIGSLQTPEIKMEGTARLTFKAGGWADDTHRRLKVSVSNGAKISLDPLDPEPTNSVQVEMPEAEWGDFVLYISDVAASTKITFAAGYASKNRFFLDEILLKAYTPSSVTALSLEGALTQTEYQIGEKFNVEGLTVMASLSDGTTQDVSAYCQWTVDPETLTEAQTQKVSVSATYGGKSVSEVYEVTVSRKPSTITIADMEMGVGNALAIQATTTPEDAALTYQVPADQQVISIAEGVITALAPGEVTVTATFDGNEEYAPAKTTFQVKVDAYSVAEITSFSKTSGAFGDKNAINYQAFKGSGTSQPVVNSNHLRLYQGGSYLMLSGAVGVTIKQVTITTSSSYKSATVGVAVDDAPKPSTTESWSKNTQYTISDLSCDSIKFYSMGSGSNDRLEIAAIQVKYEQVVGIELESLTLDVTNATTEFIQNTAFNHNNVVVTAHYSDGSTQNVSALADFSTPDMTVAGPATVTVSYNGKTVDYNINIVAEQVTALALSGSYPVRFHYGEDFDHTGLEVTATYNSGRTEKVTEGAAFSKPDMSLVGRQTVTVSFGGQEKDYLILVLDPNILFYESFDLCNALGGNDDKWSGNLGSGAVKTDTEGWYFTKGGATNQCIKLGTANDKGSATTPKMTLSAEGTYILTFRAAAWEADETYRSLQLSATNATLSTTAIEMENAAWQDYAVAINDIQGPVSITIQAANKTNNRFFLDEVKVSQGYQRAIDLTGVSAKWGTICLPKAVAPEERMGAKFFNIVSVILDKSADSGESPYRNVTGIVMEEETDTLQAGKPYIFRADSSTLTCAFHGLEKAEVAVEALGLVGNLSAAAMPVADGNYLLGNNQFHLVNGATATIAPNRAYLCLDAVPASQPEEVLGAGQLRFYFDGTVESGDVSAIEGIQSLSYQTTGVVYDIQGQRVDSLQRGKLYVRDGKKIIVK